MGGLLTRDEERELIRRAKGGDVVARNTLVERNLGLVGNLARAGIGVDMDVDDLFQCGIFGLIDAIERFDLARDCRFSTYAMWRVRRHVTAAIKRELEKRRRFFGATGEDSPPLEDLCPDYRTPDADPTNPAHPEVAEAIARLPPRHRIVITRRFGLVGEPATLADVGREIGVTKERVRQIQGKAIVILRTILERSA